MFFLILSIVVQSFSHVHCLQPHGLQRTRFPCPSPSPRACSNSCPLSRWFPPPSTLVFCHPLFLLPSVFPVSGHVLMIRHFTSGGQSIRASASVLLMNIQDWFPLGWTGFISLQPGGLSRVFSNTTVHKHHFFGTQPSFWSNSHIHTWHTRKTIALTIWTFVGKAVSLL